MTQLAATIPKIPPLADELDDGVDTPTRIDRQVKKLRESRPAAVDELRKSPRLSISELNDLDWNQVRERMAKTSFDNRGPVTRFLDIIDLPRNTIANVVARGLAPKLRERQTNEGETAALDQPRIYTSDILKELGVRPGLVAGTLGFIGDVALDPLTYVGPPGWGAKVATKGGQVLRLGATETRALRGAVKGLAKGIEPADALHAGLYHETTLPRLVAERNAALAEKAWSPLAAATPIDDARKASEFSKDVFGNTKTGLIDRLKTGDIFGLEGSGGELADSTLRATKPGRDYAKEIVARGMEGAPLAEAAGGTTPWWQPRMTPKGPAFGNGQSAIAHIPFTEYGIYVPGFTRAGRGRLALRAGAMAKAGATGDALNLLSFDAKTGEMAKLADEGKSYADKHINATTPEESAQALADMQFVDQKLTALEQESSALARNMATNPNFTAGDLLHVNDRLNAITETRKAYQASLDAIPGELKTSTISGNEYRSFRDTEKAKIKATAESLAGVPELRAMLEDVSSKNPYSTVSVQGTGVSIRDSLPDNLKPVFDSLPERIKQEHGIKNVVVSDSHGAVGMEDHAARFDQSSNTLGVFNKSRRDQSKDALNEMIASFAHYTEDKDLYRDWRKAQFPSGVSEPGSGKYPFDGVDLSDSFARSVMKYIDGKSSPELKAVFDKHLSSPKKIVSPEVEAASAKLAAAEAEVPKHIEDLRRRNAMTVANDVLDMSDAELEKRAFEVRSTHKMFEAYSNLEAATKGAIVANLDNDQQALRDLSKYLLGIDDDMLKSGIFLGTATAAKDALGKDRNAGLGLLSSMAGADGSLRKLLGDRRSLYDRLRNNVARTIEQGSPYEVQAVVRQVAGEAAKPVIAELGLKTDQQLDQFWTLVHTRMFQKLREADPSQILEKYVKDGELVDSPWAQKMKASADAGWFGGGVEDARYKALLPKVDQIAQSMIDHYKMLGADLGEDAASIYSPNRLTPLAAREAARKKGSGFNVNAMGESRAAYSSEQQAFEKQRGMMTYIWNEGGKPHQMDEADFAYIRRFLDGNSPDGWNDAYRELGTPGGKAHAENLAKMREEYESFNRAHPMPEGLTTDDWDAARRQYLGKIADPWYLNATGSRYRAIDGGSPVVQELFSTNALHLLAQRQAEQFAAKARNAFAPMLDKLALDYSKELARSEDAINGKVIHFRGGGTGYVLKGADNKFSVIVGDTVYRPLALKPEDLQKTGMMQGVLDNRDLMRYYPEQFAELIERAHAVASKPGDLENMAKVAEKLTGLWKTTTLAHPSWPIFNLVGLVWNAAMGRVPLDLIGKHAKDALRIVLDRGNLDGLAGREVTLNGQRHSLADLAVDSHIGLSGSTRTGEVMGMVKGTGQHTYGEGVRPGVTAGDVAMSRASVGDLGRQMVEDTRGGLGRVMPEAKSDFQRRSEMYAREWAVGKALDPAQKLKIAGEQFYDEALVRRFFQPWFKMNATMEEWFKTAAYMAMVDSGHAPSAAMSHIAETFFDFANMTNAERKIRRYFIPFYAWLRSNSAYQMRKVLVDPKWAAMVPKLKEAIEESIAGDEQLPEHVRPNWLREQLAIQVGKDPDTRSALSIGTVIPTEPVYQAGGATTGNEGIQNLIKWFTSGLNPVWSVPLQIGAGREFFSGRTIGANEGEGDMSMGEFLASQVRPVRELGAIGGPRTAPLVKAFEKGVGQGVGRATLGGRFQGFDDERLRIASQREVDERANELRKYIALSEREGDHERSLSGRVKLMSLFADAERRSLKIPAWARSQLAGSQ